MNKQLLSIFAICIVLINYSYSQVQDSTEAGVPGITYPPDDTIIEDEIDKYLSCIFDYPNTMEANSQNLEVNVSIIAFDDLYDVDYSYTIADNSNNILSDVVFDVGSMQEGDSYQTTLNIPLPDGFEGDILLNNSITIDQNSSALPYYSEQVFISINDSNQYELVGPEQFLSHPDVYVPLINATVNQRPHSNNPVVATVYPTTQTGYGEYQKIVGDNSGGFTYHTQEAGTANVQLDDLTDLFIDGSFTYNERYNGNPMGILGLSLTIKQLDDNNYVINTWGLQDPFEVDPLTQEKTIFFQHECKNALSSENGMIKFLVEITFFHPHLSLTPKQNGYLELMTLSTGYYYHDLSTGNDVTIDINVPYRKDYARTLLEIWAGLYDGYYYANEYLGYVCYPQVVRLFTGSGTSFYRGSENSIYINISRGKSFLRHTAGHEFGHKFHYYLLTNDWPHWGSSADHYLWGVFPTKWYYWGRNGSRRGAFKEGFANFYGSWCIYRTLLRSEVPEYYNFDNQRPNYAENSDRVEGNVARTLWSLVSDDRTVPHGTLDIDYGGIPNCHGFDVIKMNERDIFSAMTDLEPTTFTKNHPFRRYMDILTTDYLNNNDGYWRVHRWVAIQAATRNTCTYSNIVPYTENMFGDIEIAAPDGVGARDDVEFCIHNNMGLELNNEVDIYMLATTWYCTPPGGTRTQITSGTDLVTSVGIDIESMTESYLIECEVKLDLNLPNGLLIETTLQYETNPANYGNVIGPGQVRISDPLILEKEGPGLEILPGTEVVFEDDGYIEIEGWRSKDAPRFTSPFFSARGIEENPDGPGTIENPITFNESSNCTPLDHPRIYATRDKVNSSFQNCIFTNFRGIAISTGNSDLDISNCQFYNCETGIKSSYHGGVSENDFYECTNGVKVYENGSVSNSYFQNVNSPIKYYGSLGGSISVNNCNIDNAFLAIKVKGGSANLSNNVITNSTYGIKFKDTDRTSHLWGNNIDCERRAIIAYNSHLDLKHYDNTPGKNYLRAYGNTGIPLVVVGNEIPVMEGGFNHLVKHPIWNISAEFIFGPNGIPLPSHHETIYLPDNYWGDDFPPLQENVHLTTSATYEHGVIKTGLQHLEDDPVYGPYENLGSNNRYRNLDVYTNYFSTPESFTDLFELESQNTASCTNCHSGDNWANVNQAEGGGGSDPVHGELTQFVNANSTRYHSASAAIEAVEYDDAVEELKDIINDMTDLSLSGNAIRKIVECQISDERETDPVDETVFLTNLRDNTDNDYIKYMAGSALAKIDVHEGNYSNALLFYENYLNQSSLSPLEIARARYDAGMVFIEAARKIECSTYDGNLETRLNALTFGSTSSLKPTSLDVFYTDIDQLYEDLEPDYTFDKYNLEDPVTWDQPLVELNQDLYIFEGATLTINPGTVVVSNGHSIVVEGGELIAQGTENSKILFCGPSAGEICWDGIGVKGTGSATLDHVKIVDAKYGLYVTDVANVEITNFEIDNTQNAGIRATTSDSNSDGCLVAGMGIVKNCPLVGIEIYKFPTKSIGSIEISDCGTGIKASQCTPLIRECSIHDNLNAGVEFVDCDGGDLRDNEIENNGTYGVYIFSSSPLLRSNDIMTNTHNGLHIINGSATLGETKTTTGGNLFYNNGAASETDALRAEIYIEKGSMEIGDRHNDLIDGDAPYLFWNLSGYSSYPGWGNYFRGSTKLSDATYPAGSINPKGVDTQPNNDRGISTAATGFDLVYEMEEDSNFVEAAEAYLSLALEDSMHVAFDGWIRCLKKSGMPYESLMSHINNYLDHDLYAEDAYWLKLRIQNSFMDFENTIIHLDEFITEAETENDTLRGLLGQLDTYYEMFMSDYVFDENQGESNISGGGKGKNTGGVGSRNTSSNNVKRENLFLTMTPASDLNLPVIGNTEDILPESMDDYYMKRQMILAKLVGREVENAGEVILPTEFKLGNAYPNPFNPTVNIPFDMMEKAEVTIAVYNVLGRKVATLINRPVAAGHHSVIWEGVSDTRERVSSGIYFIQMKTPEYVQTKKVVMLK